MVFVLQNPKVGETGAIWDRGWMGHQSFQHVPVTFFFKISIPYMRINITNTEKNFHRNCTSSLLVMSENKFFGGGGENS